jgi:hypothetical protein
MSEPQDRHEAPARHPVGWKSRGDSFERLTHSTGQKQRASPSLLVTLTIKVVLSDAEEVHTISFRRLVLSAQRPGNVQRP